MSEGSASSMIGRKESLASQRVNFDGIWDDVQRYVWPDGGLFQRKDAQGQRKTGDVYEMTAALALEKFAAVQESFLIPRNTTWARVAASDENLNKDPAVKAFFDDVTNVLFKMRNAPRARFYGQFHENFKSLGAYGNGCIYIDELPQGGTRYKYTHIGSAWIEQNFEGVVDTIYYEYELSAKAAFQRWGEKAPDSVKSKLATSPFDKMKFMHVVRPNNEFDPVRADADGMAFEAFDVCADSAEFIGKKSGFHEMPYVWSRYTLNPSETYGRGPAMLVLPDIQTLQEMEKVFLRSGHKVAAPPLLVADDGVLGHGSKQIRVTPDGLNIGGLDANGNPLIRPLETGARLDLTKEMMDIKRETIRGAFLVDLLTAFQNEAPVRTATEVLERAKEKGQILTPVIGRQQSELLSPVHERELGIAQRSGLIGELPDALLEAEGEYEIVYESDVTRMQKSEEAAGFSRLLEVMTPFIEQDPSILDKFKADEVIDHFASVFAVPTKVINTEAEMKQIREGQAQAQAEQNQLDQIEQGSNAVRNLSAVQGGAAA